MVQVTLSDEKTKTFLNNPSGLEIARSISNDIARTCIAIELNNQVFDLNTEISEDSHVRLITSKDPEALEIMRHTAAHVMAQAILNLYPDAQLTIGPVIKDGFYYDIDMQPLSDDAFPQIEAEMNRIIKTKTPITRKNMSKADALLFYKNEPYKTEIISKLQDGTISFYEQGNFMDLCKGPHAPHTGFVKSVKLMRVSGAYWHADQSKAQLQRIYGTAFFSKKEMNAYINFLHEARKRDHRKIAKNMALVSFHNEAPGMPLFHPKGMVIWNTLLKYWREEHQKENYQEIQTPIILDRSLWEKSGHWKNYRENMYTTKVDDQEFAIKPMNCPGSMLYYKSRPHSYRELPMRVAEVGIVHRHELSGVLNGLFRVRAFHQDDAHIFIKQSQVSHEILRLLKFCERICKTFGLGFEIELSTKPEKSIGTHEQWQSTTNDLELALEMYGKEFRINAGSGAFYGPKIDLHMEDALNRTWQCGTIQLDMSLPERFDLYYIGNNNEKHRPLVLHRTIFGSIERFFAILIEHFAGKFPLWLAPVQAIILPMNDTLVTPSKKLALRMKDVGIRTEVDTKTGNLNKKIRTAQIGNIPLMLTYGSKEHEARTLAVRTLDGRVAKNIGIANFISNVTQHITQRKLRIDFL